MPTPEAIYRKVNPADVGRLEGRDNRISRDVYSWLCTGTDSTMSGLRRASPAQLAESLGWSIPNIKSALGALHDMRMIVWSPEVSVVYVFTAAREPPQNERHCKGLKRDTSWCPPCSAKSQALEDIGDRRDRVSDTVVDTVSHTSTQDQVHRIKDQDLPTPPSAAPRKKALSGQQEALDLMTLWNATCLDLPHVRVESGVLCDTVAKAWRKEPDLIVWRTRFAKIQASEWHSGRSGGWRGGSLTWAVTSGRALIDGRRDDGGNECAVRLPARGVICEVNAEDVERANNLVFARMDREQEERRLRKAGGAALSAHLETT